MNQSNKFNIFHYTNLRSSSAGGVEKFIHYHVNALDKLGHHSHIGSSLMAALHPSSHFAGTIIHTHGDRLPDLNLVYQLKLKNFLKRSPIRWIHIAHGNSLQRVLDCKEYFSLSGYRGILRDLSLTKLCDGLIAVSKHAAEETRKYFLYSGLEQVIQNGVDTALFTPAPSLTTRPDLFFVGRNQDRVKNYSLLIAAVKAIFLEHDDLQLYVAPSDDTAHTFIKPLGKIKAHELALRLKKSRALVLCSKYEGDPLVAREAMAVGIPIVASDIPALKESLDGYGNAFYFKSNDLKSLTQTLTDVLYKKNLSINPKVRDWNQVANEYLDFYRKL